MFSFGQCRGPPKKKRRTTIASTESSVVPFHKEAPASSMRFPPRFAWKKCSEFLLFP